MGLSKIFYKNEIAAKIISFKLYSGNTNIQYNTVSLETFCAIDIIFHENIKK